MLRFLRVMCAFGVAVGIILAGACESEPNTENTDGSTDTGHTPPAQTNDAVALYIIPASASVGTNAGDTATFKAGGGTSPYAFAVSDGGLGALGPQTDNADGSASITYTSQGGSGANTVTVTDGAGGTKQATVSHSP